MLAAFVMTEGNVITKGILRDQAVCQNVTIEMHSEKETNEGAIPTTVLSFSYSGRGWEGTLLVTRNLDQAPSCLCSIIEEGRRNWAVFDTLCEHAVRVCWQGGQGTCKTEVFNDLSGHHTLSGQPIHI